MTPEDYVVRVGRELRALEARLSRLIRGELLLAFARIRDLVATLPDDGISRPLAFAALRAAIEDALVPLNDALAAAIADELYRFQRRARELAALWRGSADGPDTDGHALMERARFLRHNLASYFQRRSPSQFMREILRLVDRTVQRGLLEGTPTAEIVAQILPEATRGGRRSLVIRRGTVVNAVRARVDATIASAIWHTFTQTSQEVWRSDTAEGELLWEWSAILDPKTCPVCAPLDGQRRQSPSGFGVLPPVHPHCVLGDTPVTAGGLVAATRAVYSGNIVTIRTESGRQFTVTAQHPMLTDHGWVRANELTNGVHLIRHRNRIPSTLDLPNLDNSPPTAAEVFQAFRASRGVATDVVPSAPMYFHGDGEGIQGEIEVVRTNRPLQMNPSRQLLKLDPQLKLIDAHTELEFVTGLSPTDLLLLAVNATASGLMGFADEALTLLSGQGSHANAHRFAATARNHPALAEPVYQHVPRTAKLLRELLDALPALVATDQIVNVNIEAAHGITVYDFTTSSSIYSVDTTISHNCRCALLPVPA